MHKLNDALRGTPGLQQVGAWREQTSGRIVALSIWQSGEAFQAAFARIGTVVADVPFDQWEERPRELFRAEEVAFPT